MRGAAEEQCAWIVEQKDDLVTLAFDELETQELRLPKAWQGLPPTELPARPRWRMASWVAASDHMTGLLNGSAGATSCCNGLHLTVQLLSNTMTVPADAHDGWR